MAWTDRHEAFCQAVVETGNQSEAYRRAYPHSASWKDNAVHVRASQLMKRDKVQLRLKQLRQNVAQRHHATIDAIIQELSRTAFMDPIEAFTQAGDLKNITEIPAELRRCIASIEVVVTKGCDTDNPIEIHTKKIKFYNKLTALDKLGQHLGMFRQQVDVNLTDSAGIVAKLAAGRARIEGG